jgi:hypothetical protein
MSPKEFYALSRCYQEHLEHLDWQIAGMKSFYAQCKGVSITAEEFMGKKKQASKKRLPSDEELTSTLESLFGCGPGKE